MEIALAVLLVLSLPIIAIADLVIAIGARDRATALEQRFADFQRRRTEPVHPAPPPSVAIPAELLPQQRAAASV